MTTMASPATNKKDEEFGKDLGLIHELIITGRKVGAGFDFFKRLASNELLLAHLVEEAQAYEAQEVTLDEAIKILGKRSVLTAKQVGKLWQAELPQQVHLPVTREMLRQCAVANRQGTARWRLGYYTGGSLRQQRQLIGTDTSQRASFCPQNTWWLEPREDGWATTGAAAGYYLVNFHGQFGATSWQSQEEKIVALGDGYFRPHEAVVSELAFSFLKIWNERNLKDFWHWGVSQSACGNRVNFGFLDAAAASTSAIRSGAATSSCASASPGKFQHRHSYLEVLVPFELFKLKPQLLFNLVQGLRLLLFYNCAIQLKA